MKQIRAGVFETNSSSTHSITICTKEEFKKLKARELMCSRYGEGLVPTSEVLNGKYSRYEYTSYENLKGDWFEKDVTSFTTPSGDNMVAICVYGND